MHIEDDDGDAALFLAVASKAMPGAQVRRAVDLGSGLKAIEAGAVDVVVTDLRMPGSDGVTAPIAIRALHPDMPLIVLTIRDDRQTQKAVLEVGADVFISKNELRSSLVSRAIDYALEKRPRTADRKS